MRELIKMSVDLRVSDISFSFNLTFLKNAIEEKLISKSDIKELINESTNDEDKREKIYERMMMALL